MHVHKGVLVLLLCLQGKRILSCYWCFNIQKVSWMKMTPILSSHLLKQAAVNFGSQACMKWQTLPHPAVPEIFKQVLNVVGTSHIEVLLNMGLQQSLPLLPISKYSQLPVYNKQLSGTTTLTLHQVLMHVLNSSHCEVSLTSMMRLFTECRMKHKQKSLKGQVLGLFLQHQMLPK